MSTPTAGPDDRSPTPTDDELRALLDELVSVACDIGTCFARDQITDAYESDAARVRDLILSALRSALRSARRDVARLEWVMASSYQGIMVEPHTVRPGLIAEGTQYGPYHVDATREGIDAAMPQ